MSPSYALFGFSCASIPLQLQAFTQSITTRG